MAQETLKITITADNQQAVKNIQETVTATTNLGNAFKKLPNASGQATMALSNLSRVAQDAPYGFMGIANNINPLLESFQRLQASSGSTGKALKAMGSVLMGPAGIGLAVGVVSSLFVSFGDEILNFITQSSGAEASLSKLNETMSKNVGEAQAEIDKLVILNGIVSDTTKSTAERERALNQLKTTYKGNLELQALDIQDGTKLTGIIDGIAAALKRKAMAQAFATIIAEEEAKKVRLQMQDMNQMRESVGGATKAWQFIKSAITGAGSAMSVVELNTALTTKALDGNAAAINEVDGNLKRLNTQYGAVIGDQVKFNDTTTLSTSSLKKQSTETKTATDDMKEYIRAANAIAAPSREMRRKAVGIDYEVGTLVPPKKLPTALPAFATQYEAEQADKTKNDLDAYNQKLQLASQLSSSIANGVTGVFDAMANGESVGSALETMFKNMAMQLTQMVIQALIFKTIMSAFGLGGVSGSGGGLGGLGKLLGLASGGIVTGPTLAMIGEGSESEAVMPLSKLDAVMGNAFASGAASGGSASGGNFVLRGQDLVLALQRSNSALTLRR
jgi:hypothetical protein